MVINLFESRGKSYSPVTIKVWVDRLQKYDPVLLPLAIDHFINYGDDFPTTSKIHDQIGILDMQCREEALKLFFSNTKESQAVAKLAGFEIPPEKFMFVEDNAVIFYMDKFKKFLDAYKRSHVNKTLRIGNE